MKKIAEYIAEMDAITGFKKRAFIPAPQQGGGTGGGGGGGQMGANAQQGGQAPQGGDPSQGGGGGGQMDPQTEQLFQQVAQMVQQLSPDIQQQVAPQLQQIQQLPPEQQGQALQQIAQGLQQSMSSGQGDPSMQGGQQGGGQSPQGENPNDPSAQVGLPSGHMQAENDLDNTQVTLTVRELMDITSGGKATASHLKVKQLVDQHNQKMTASKQKQQMDMQNNAMAQQQGGMGQSGGIYPTAPGTQ